MTILVATGVAREAAVLRRRLAGAVVVAGGGDADGLKRRLEARLAGVTAIASIGLGGALDPGLAIGDWVVADRIIGPVLHDCDPAWSAAITAALPHAHRGAIYADGRLIADPSEKRALATQAIAVDMESHVAAAVAGAHGLPFAAARCISDSADRALPPAIAVAMRPDGGLDARAILSSILRQPTQLADLMATGIGFAKAFAIFRATAPTLSAISDTGS